MGIITNGQGSERDPLLKRQAQTVLSLDKDTGPKNSVNADAKSELFGYVLLLLSTACYCVMTLTARAASAYHGADPKALVFVRGLAQTIAAIVIIFGFMSPREIFSLSRRMLLALAIRGLFGGVAMALIYRALSLATLGTVTSIFFLNPIIAMILSAVVLHEAVGLLHIVASFLSFTGVFLVSNPELSLETFRSHSSPEILGVYLALVSALLAAIAFTTIRYMGTRVSFMASVLSFGIFVSAIGAMIGGTSIRPLFAKKETAFLSAIMCISGFLGQCLISSGFQHCSVGVGTLLRNTDVPMAFLFGVLFLGEVPHIVSLFGSALVVSGSIIAGTSKILAMRRAASNERM